ncbi:MAG: SDR family oxidoreductase [Candidatus Thermoplasmatota archaeon]|jgi:NAD(P)-dependent dehydrogenase (short-subunit alcohol dehydrogenase family)|nr:SDR family oxidoreductase [Candidatus Thermoplasmatota archaeon]MCL5794516.1 SDR family oxidoreductase [Candidatus Thermoplasmatota archaeon]
MSIFKDGLLKDRHVLITGAGSGIGRGMAMAFSSLGAHVSIVGRREEKLAETAHMIEETGNKCLFRKCDVRNLDEVRAAISYFKDALGEPNVLVNNAAGNFISRTEDLSFNAFRAVMDIVMQGTLHFTMELGKSWISGRNSGTILNIVAGYAESGSGYVVPSAIAKAGVLSLTRSLAAEWGKYGIRSIAISPGLVPTEGSITRLAPTEELQKAMLNRIPLKRYCTPEEIADLASFLISDAASFINGDVVTMDGGERQWLSGQFNFLDALAPEHWDLIRSMRRG